MSKASTRSNVGETASRLRALSLARAEGEFLGNEDALERELAVSKPTMRQAARMVEREGLLRVRRGNAGGYFVARPDADFIEATVASYLEGLHARPQDLTRVASALWVETVRQAALIRHVDKPALARQFLHRLARLPDTASFSDVQRLEQDLRSATFALIESPYVELIFNINANFARRTFLHPPGAADQSERHRTFVKDWRKSAQLLVSAIEEGDAEIAAIAARRGRDLIHLRIWPETAEPAAA